MLFDSADGFPLARHVAMSNAEIEALIEHAESHTMEGHREQSDNLFYWALRVMKETRWTCSTCFDLYRQGDRFDRFRDEEYD